MEGEDGSAAIGIVVAECCVAAGVSTTLFPFDGSLVVVVAVVEEVTGVGDGPGRRVGSWRIESDWEF